MPFIEPASDTLLDMPEDAADQLNRFIGEFDPAMAQQIRDCRAAMRKRFPTAHELVYDNYNFFVIGYGPTERPSDAVASIAANAKGVNLNFLYGSKLPDPHKILQGAGGQNRFVRLEGAETLGKPAVRDLLAAAMAQAEPPFPTSGAGKLIIRSVSKKQRPRR
jgi:hypothetical protein